MNIETIIRQWQPQHKNSKSGVGWWNNSAERFSEKELPTKENSMAMRIIAEENMLPEGAKVLDVGCGCGRFSFALEAMGAKAAATDFSPKMIEQAEIKRAEHSSDIQLSVDDWHTLNLADKGWSRHFDLVLAHMTPAIVSGETFMKLSEASKNWVLMVKPSRRTNTVLDKLHALVGAAKDKETLDEAVAYAFNLVWLSGWRPKLAYEDQVWENSLPLDKAIEEYTLRIASSQDLTDENRDAIRKHLESIAVDGIVHETTNVLITAMYWQVNTEKQA